MFLSKRNWNLRSNTNIKEIKTTQSERYIPKVFRLKVTSTQNGGGKIKQQAQQSLTSGATQYLRSVSVLCQTSISPNLGDDRRVIKHYCNYTMTCTLHL